MATTVNEGIFDFPDHKSGDTFNALLFECSFVNGKNLVGALVEMTMDGKVYSSDTTGITITDGPNSVFKFDKQIITHKPYIYPYEIKFTFADGDVQTYIRGNWKIYG